MNCNGNGRKIEAVFIRKSTREQDENGQIGNVESMLKESGVSVPADQWFMGTVSRRKVKANADFLRLMEMVEKDRVRTVYVESQDRWGTKDRPELFSLLGTLRDHGTKLFDLRAKKDLTERDFATELLAFVGSIKSEKELQDIVLSFIEKPGPAIHGDWFLAHGDAPLRLRQGVLCGRRHAEMGMASGQPKDRPDILPSPKGLTPGPANVKIPRKDKRDITKLVLNRNADYVRAVQIGFRPVHAGRAFPAADCGSAER